MNDISSNIKKVLFVFLLCFMSTIMYITYFEIFVGPKMAVNPLNKRLWAKRNEVLRGTIYDRNKQPLTKSERSNVLTQKREYIYGEVFSHTLGYVDIRYGLTGLEKKYDNELMEYPLQLTSLLDFNKKDEKIGNSVITTLDLNLQKKTYELLGDNIGAAVAINPKTGEILAMVSKPTFNPNNLKDIWSDINSNKRRPLLNRAVAGLYPPGSTFKTVTAVSALDNLQGVQNRTFQDNGVLVFNARDRHPLNNFNGEVLGNLSLEDAFVHSSNVVFGTLGMDLGNKNLKATAEKFYFNKNIPAEGITIENSRFPELKKYEIGNIARSAIGQSTVLSTPTEMALVTAAIANNGSMMKPTLVKEVISSKGESIKTINAESIGQVTSVESAQTVKRYMREVVRRGTGRGAGLDSFEVCGKTGTADHNDNCNEPPHAWFIGFAPYENPKIAVAVLIENGGQGGIISAQIASNMIETYLQR